MQCREFDDRMNDVLDRRQVPERDALLLRHAGECLPCRQTLCGQAALLAGLELGETPQPSSQFAAAVLVQASVIPVATIADTRRGGKKWAGAIAAIVSLAAVVIVAVLINLSRQQGPARPTANKPASPMVAPTTVEIARSLPEKKESVPVSIAQTVTTPGVEPTAPEKENYQEYRDALNSFTAQLPSAVEKIDEVQQATPAIRPIRASFSMAIGTLQRTIPSRTKRDTRPIKPDSGFHGHQRDVVV